jgi:chromosome partitioning protein
MTPMPTTQAGCPIVAIAGRKGGSGKTTTAINLAGALAERGKRIALIDLDSQASLTRLLLRGDAHNVEGIGARILAVQRGLDGLAHPTAVPNIELYPGDRAIESAALALAENPMGSLRLRKLVRSLTGYDVIIIDTPPHLGFALNSALLAADLAILPTDLVQQDIDALADTIDLRDELEELGAARVMAILPNAVRNDSVDRTSLLVLKEHWGDLVALPIPLSVTIKAALNAALPVVTYEPKSAAAQAYRTLAERLEQETAHAAAR